MCFEARRQRIIRLDRVSVRRPQPELEADAFDAPPAVVIDALKHDRPRHDISGDGPGVKVGFKLGLFQGRCRHCRKEWLQFRVAIAWCANRQFETAAVADDRQHVSGRRRPDNRPIGVGDCQPDAVARAEAMADIAELQRDVIGLARFKRLQHFMAVAMREIEDAIADARCRPIREDLAECRHQQGAGPVGGNADTEARCSQHIDIRIKRFAVKYDLPTHFLALVQRLVRPGAIGTPLACRLSRGLRRGHRDGALAINAETAW